MKKVCVLGLGVSGQAAVRFLLRQGVSVFGVDRREFDLDFLSFREGDPLPEFDTLVVSPGVPSTHPLIREATVPVLGEVELAFRYAKEPIIGITGTNGKTTATLLTAHTLNYCGVPALAVGNVGKPITEAVGCGKVLVVELSSYQIETLQTAKIDIGAVLNITPDHLDRYGTMEPYAKAKMGLQRCIKPEGVFFVGDEARDEYGHLLDEEKIASFIPMKHKERASFSLCKQMGVSQEQFLEAVDCFVRPPHRMEFVETIAGVTYINDSKGTNVAAVMHAVESLEGNIVLIAGGRDKDSSYEPWLTAFSGKVQAVCLIGEATDAIAKTFGERFTVYKEESLERAVVHARQLANRGETVLLSPGCSSFDQFENYEVRGNHFKEIVRNL